jgi:hypothetical protein
MLKGFEQITIELNNFEMVCANTLIEWFKSNKGKNNVIKNSQISGIIEKNFHRGLPDSRIRKVIQYVRMNGHPNVIATSKGYYCSEDIDEIAAWVKSLKQREAAIKNIREKAERHLEIMKFRKYSGNQIEIF